MSVELKKARGCSAHKIRSTEMGYGKYAPTFDMSELWNILQGSNCNAKKSSSLAKFCNIIGDDTYFSDMLSGLQN